MLTKELLADYIDAGAAKKKADLVIQNGTLINVNTGEYYPADVAVYKDKIVAVDPDVSDYIIKYCLDRKYNEDIVLEPLDDTLENLCRKQLLDRFLKSENN